MAQKYRHIRSDLEPVIEQLQAGEILGDQVPRIEYILYKLRVRNSDVERGKSGGYRLIYCLQNAEQLILVTLYSKSEQDNLNISQIRRLLEEMSESKNNTGTEDNL